jgi:hypothetical protein
MHAERPLDPPDPGTPPFCTCLQPIPRPRASYKGAARTYCDRCDRPVPLRLVLPIQLWP